MDRGHIFGQLFDIGVDILVTTLGKATGVVTAQLGDSTAGKPDSDNAEWWQHAGFISRPALPTNGGASCQGLILKCSDRDLVFATRDTRGTSIYGNLADGETCVYASGSQALSVWKRDGSVRHMTTDNNKPPSPTDGSTAGKAMYYGMSPGGAKGVAAGGEWRIYAPWGGEWFDASGFHQRYWFGGADDVGVSQIPGVPVMTTTRTLSYDFLTLDAAFVSLGRSNGVGQPDALVQATWATATFALVATALGAIAAALVDIGKSLTALGQPAPSIPAAAAPIAAAVTALGSTKAAGTTRSTTAT